MSQNAPERLERLRQLNKDRDWVNTDLYRLMFREDLYIIAYEGIKSEPGNMTPGTDGTTLDGYSLEMIRQVIGEMRSEAFQFKPARTHYIPKANGKMRRLGIPSTRDKVVQEVMRMILEAIYDSPYGPYFCESSHGFRSGRGCHSALQEFRRKWSAVNWIVEGDIKSFFDDVDHGILVTLLRKKIQDERFISLIWKLLRAGYWDITGGRKDSLVGTPQGGIVSPILANIYLNELDEFVEGLRQKYEKGKTKRINPEYKRLQYHKLKLAKAGQTRTDEFRALLKRLRQIPAMDVRDPNFIRLKYIRYADDWIIGIWGPYALAEQVKGEVKEFLDQHLLLTLSEEKTRITNAKTEEALFLGTRLSAGTVEQQMVTTTVRGDQTFQRRSTGWEPIMKTPMERLVKKLHERGFCLADGHPVAKNGWTILDIDQIINQFSAISRGLQNYYRFADNYSAMRGIQHILHMSLAKTLAKKLNIRYSKVFKRFGRSITYTHSTRDGRERKVAFYFNTHWTRDRDAFQTRNTEVDLVRMAIRMRTRSKLGNPCCICGAAEQVEMHHVRHIRKVGDKPAAGFTRLMQVLNRKQVPVCESCHRKIHRGEYDSLKLSDLVYDPR